MYCTIITALTYAHVFRTNTVVLSTNLVIKGINTVIHGPNTVILGTNKVAFRVYFGIRITRFPTVCPYEVLKCCIFIITRGDICCEKKPEPKGVRKGEDQGNSVGAHTIFHSIS